MTLDEESTRLRELLGGKIVTDVLRHRADEIVVEFSDGSRMIVDAPSDLENLRDLTSRTSAWVGSEPSSVGR